MLARHPDSHTGSYLKPLLESNGHAPLPVAPASGSGRGGTSETGQSSKEDDKKNDKEARQGTGGGGG